MAGLVTLKNSFEKEGDLEHVGSTEYLAELAFSAITIINAEVMDARSMTCICAAS